MLGIVRGITPQSRHLIKPHIAATGHAATDVGRLKLGVPGTLSLSHCSLCTPAYLGQRMLVLSAVHMHGSSLCLPASQPARSGPKTWAVSQHRHGEMPTAFELDGCNPILHLFAALEHPHHLCLLEQV
eukprot:1150595-Pelagomonas_calceolata.AAC.3